MLKSKRFLHNKIKNSGFTLVELVVTMMVFAIVVALTTMGILAWQDWSRFNQQNEYAQTLFIAAQNQLAEYSANGRLMELQDSLAGGSLEAAMEDDRRGYIFCPENKYGANLTGRMSDIHDENGEAYDLNKLFPESEDKGIQELYRNEIVTLRAETGDYDLYLDNPQAFKQVDPEAYWIFELLGSYVYDTTILNGVSTGSASIAVELTPESGQVLSVFYSDKNDRLIYLSFPDYKGYEEGDKTSDISVRTEDYRRERMVGYYGVDTLYAATKNEMIRPSIASVKLVNKETFYMTFRLTAKYRAITSLLTYELDLDASKNTSNRKLTVVLDGKKLNNREHASTIDCPVYRYDESGEKVEVGTFPMLAWVESDSSVHVIYDAVDIQATTHRYESELSKIRSEQADQASFSQTYSFFRFGVDADDVYATVCAKGDGYTDSKLASNFGNLNPLKNQTGKNPCFASISSSGTADAKAFRYTLLNPRHFHNIRYIEDISYEKEAGGYDNANKIASVDFELKSDIDWAQFQASGHVYSSNVTNSKIDLSAINGKVYNMKDEAISSLTRFNCNFPSFKQLRAKDGFDGRQHTISGINSSEISNVLYNVYTSSSDMTLSEVKPIGLFNVNYGTVKDLVMDDFAIRGSDMVGAFCGVNAGKVEKLRTADTHKYSKVTGVKNIGGIMGFQLITKSAMTIEDLENRAAVTGTEAVGGIVGMVRNDFSDMDIDFTKFGLSISELNALISSGDLHITIERCKNYGKIGGVSRPDLKGVYVSSDSPLLQGSMPDTDPEKIRYVGGIVGYCYNKDVNDTNKVIIASCTSSPQYSGEDINAILSSSATMAKYLKGDYIGGIAGYNYFGTIRNCSAIAEKGKAGYIFGYRYVGGIVGFNIGPSSGIYGGSDSSKGINENNVIACYCAGGITGANANVMDEAISYDGVTKVQSKDPEVLTKHDAILEPNRERSLEVKIENWTNEGVVIATKEYAGGITGFNSGWIYNCHSNVSATNVANYFATMAANMDLGDYCGGIAGYNNGIIGNTPRTISADKKDSVISGATNADISAMVFVNGHNYVGGVVGYNDVDAIVENYQISGGYVKGYDHRFDDKAKSCFVGGYAGLNASVDLLMDVEGENKEARFIHSNPNSVTGSNFVGGTIGGNMINTKDFNSGVVVPDGPIDLDEKGAYDSVSGSGQATAKLSFSTILSAFPASGYVTDMTITIDNRTGSTLSGWRIPLNSSVDFEDWARPNVVNWNSGIAYDASRKELYPLNVGAANVGTGTHTYHMRVYGSQNQLQALKNYYTNNTADFYYGFSSENVGGKYDGIATDTNAVTVSYKLQSGGGNSDKYEITIKNNTEGVLPNWRVEIDIPEGAQYSNANAQNCTVERVGNVLCIRGKNGADFSVDGSQSYVVDLHLTFDDATKKAAFAEAMNSMRVLFNNVLYSGSVPTSRPDQPVVPGKPKDILAQYKTDNFLGVLEGEEFIGGYIGYNILLENDDQEAWITSGKDATKGAVYNLQSLIVEKFAEYDKNDSNKETLYAHKKAVLDDLDKAFDIEVKESPSKILISGKGADSTKTELGNIIGQIYVGGVLGYNDDDTSMIIKNVENSTPVIAKAAIAYADEQIVEGVQRTTNYLGDAYTYTYSYAGGIIGKVSRNTIVDHCWNSFSGTVKTVGTYTGGLCEINEGIVRNCEVSNFGSGVDDYLGGLCGLNKPTGEITACSYSNKSINGRNVVGGIAAENFGKIDKITLQKPRLDAAGISNGNRDGVAGLYVGYNGTNGEIVLEEDLVNIRLKSDGRFVGAVAGVNEGIVTNAKASTDNTDNNLLISGNIEGRYDVGALFGLNKDPNNAHTVKNYTNKSTVIASHGNAGGIIGENASANKIQYCVNDAVVSATIGNAGGITSSNNGEISYCYGYKSVTAPKGMCGGITAYNGGENQTNALIKECYVGPKTIGPLSSDVTFVSTLSVGGVAAWNYGVIQDNILDHVKVTNNGTVLHTSMGVVAGDNAASGRIYFKGNTQDINNCKAVATTNNCNVGGISGTNDGLIANKESYEAQSAETNGYALIGTEVKLDGANYGSIGGVAGLNTGTIAYCQVDATINGDLSTTTTGYGGIAGYNGYSSNAKYQSGKKNNHSNDSAYRAQIIGCTFDGYMRADGSAGDPANIGGITGVNGYGGLITESAIGVRETDFNGNESLVTEIISGDMTKTVAVPDETAYAYIGGIAGRNYAEITNIDLKAMSKDTTINIMSFAGAAGGMVGFQYEDGLLTGSKDGDTIHWITTSDHMYVEMRRGENDYGDGGVIGYSKSGKEIAYIKNYATVINDVNLNVKTGGVIGTIEQQKVTVVPITHVENYGRVKGLKQVGGLIGRTKYCSAKFTDCVNYGEVYATNGSAGGFISRVYDVRDKEIYFTRCDNHGYVHIGSSSGTSNYVGGLLGNIDSSQNIMVYLYDCDNTGIVDFDGKTTATNNVGDFVGNGNTGTLYFEQCQNYNTSKSANGFVGNAGIVKMKDCLDDSGNLTTLNFYSPFIGSGVSVGNNVTTKSDFNNVYYLDRENARTIPSFDQDAGAYFTFGRQTSFDNFYVQAYKFQNVKNPALYLGAPSKNLYIYHGNNCKTELHVAYDKTKCTGMKDFNIYFWYGAMTNLTAPKAVDYTVKATFKDKDGKVADVTKSITSLTGDMAADKLKFEVPAELNQEIKDIELSYTGTGTVWFHGFSYTPAGADREAECTYEAEKNATTFAITSLASNGTTRTSFNEVKVHSVNFMDEIFGLDFGPYEYFRMDRANATVSVDLDMEVNCGDDASGMDAFVFYPGNNNASATTAAKDIRTYYYDYVVTFTDINGDVASVSGSKENGTAAIGYDSSVEGFKTAVKVEVPDELDSKITHVKLSFPKALYTTTNPTTQVVSKDANSNNIYLRGIEWIPVGSTTSEHMAIGSYPVKGLEQYDQIGSVTKLLCDYENNGGTADAPYVYVENNHKIGFNMEVNDPIKDVYYADWDDYNTSDAQPDGSDSRIKVYKELHPKFVEYIQNSYTTIGQRLATPEPKAVEGDGRYIVSWDPIYKAYAYEIKYVVKDESGKVIAESKDVETVGSNTTKYYLETKEEWEGCEITFSVRAVNGYRYTGEDPTDIYRYDSYWGTTSVITKKPLPQPVVRLELTAGNRFMAILENREDYKLSDGSYADCNIDITYDKLQFNIPVATQNYSTEALYISGFNIKNDYTLTAMAKPLNEAVNYYINSIQFYLRGHVVENSQLLTTAQYVTTNFRGFYGNQADQMTYDVYYAPPDGRDCFVQADIIAYDDDLGLDVSYSSMLTHVAATAGGAKFTATLSDLPYKWFAEDFKNPIIAREYLSASQYYLAYYGHDVAKNVRLDEETMEENWAILKEIKDPYYLPDAEVGTMLLDEPIWDDANNCLKPGYTLQLRHDEYGKNVYDIHYNASIELATKAAEEKNAELAENQGPYVYYNHCVDYKIYDATKGELTFNAYGAEETKTIATVNLDDYQESYVVRNYKDATQNQKDLPTTINNLKIQELQPAPIIDREYVDEVVDGHRSYTFTFDEYYVDKYCLTLNNTKPANEWYANAEAKYMTHAPGTVASTWDAFMNKTGYADVAETNYTLKRRLMNAYYYSYLGAKYRVDLIGKTLAGEEAVIATVIVTQPTPMENITNSYMVGTTSVNTTYERKHYVATFTDTDNVWNNYSDFTVRVMRQGEILNVNNGKGLPNITKVTGANNSTFRLPRYTDYNIHVKMKLNTINNPTAYLHQENDSFVTDDLTYDVSFGAITNENQLADLGGYLIKAEVITPADPEQVAKVHYYYVKDLLPENQDDDIGLDLAELEAEGVVTEIDKESAYIVNGNSRTAVVDLSDFNTNDVVAISVKAIARANAVNYIDGDDGSTVEVKISERLKTPDVEKITLDTAGGMADASADGAPAIVTTADYEKGFLVSYGQDDNYAGSSYSNVKMNMAIAVFDQCADISDQTKVGSGDGVWDEGAIMTLCPKSDALSMGYAIDQNKVQIDLTEYEEYPGQFAGKWLKIALKATSASKIASQWTDQDADGISVNYRCIKIPMLHLDDVNAIDTNSNDNVNDIVRYTSNNLWYNKEEDIPADDMHLAYSVATKTIYTAEDACVDQYTYTIVGRMIHEEVQEDPAVQADILPIHKLTVKKHYEIDGDVNSFAGRWDILIQNISMTKRSDQDAVIIVDAPEELLTVEPIGRNSEMAEMIVDIPQIYAEYADPAMVVTAQMRYIPGTKNGVFALVLPDVTAIGDTDTQLVEDNFMTSQVMIEADVYPVANPRYEIGNAAFWMRTTDTSVTPAVYGTQIQAVAKEQVEAWKNALVEAFN